MKDYILLKVYIFMMLCHATDPTYGTICTNECPEYPTCSSRKLSFLVHTTHLRSPAITNHDDRVILKVGMEPKPEAYVNELTSCF